MAVQALYLDDTLMLNPLSLSDYPSITPSKVRAPAFFSAAARATATRPQDCFIRVDGEVPEQAQKK